MERQEKADEIYNKHYLIASEYCEEIQCSLIAKQCALAEVNGIIEALKITVDHCTLRKLDYQEVQLDFTYWKHIEQLIEKK